MATQHLTVRRGRTADRGPPHPEEQRPAPGSGPPLSQTATILTVEQIGPKREKTAQGYLLCRDVPLARTGTMLYAVGDVPVQPALGVPFLRVDRGPEDLFDPRTMGSFIGAAVVHEHPPVDVTPDNWQQLAKGYIMTVRRGDGENSDCLVGDLLITDAWLIEQISAGKREVSLGYDASYKTVSPGIGMQFNILGNHIALVERGRCGPRCAIGDSADSDPSHQPSNEEHPMADKQGGGKPRVKLAELKEQAENLLARIGEAEGNEDDGAVHVHIHTNDHAPKGDDEGGDEGGEATKTMDKAVDDRFTRIEEAQKKTDDTLAEILEVVKGKTKTDDSASVEEDDEGKGPKGDSTALEKSHGEFVSQAEILVPGYRVPTFDSASPRKATVDSMCMGRRSVLMAAYATKDGKALIDGITGKTELDLSKAGCADVAVTFKAAAATKAAINNRAATGDTSTLPKTEAPKAVTLADINAANAKHWSQR
jgi:uncharacterized protein